MARICAKLANETKTESRFSTLQIVLRHFGLEMRNMRNVVYAVLALAFIATALLKLYRNGWPLFLLSNILGRIGKASVELKPTRDWHKLHFACFPLKIGGDTGSMCCADKDIFIQSRAPQTFFKPSRTKYSLRTPIKPPIMTLLDAHQTTSCRVPCF